MRSERKLPASPTEHDNKYRVSLPECRTGRDRGGVANGDRPLEAGTSRQTKYTSIRSGARNVVFVAIHQHHGKNRHSFVAAMDKQPAVRPFSHASTRALMQASIANIDMAIMDCIATLSRQIRSFSRRSTSGRQLRNYPR